MTGGGGPKAATTTTASTATAIVSRGVDIPTQLRRRADAAVGMRPILGRSGDRLAARDPALDWPPDWPPYNLEASRRAWIHLNSAGLTSELVDRILRGAA